MEEDGTGETGFGRMALRGLHILCWWKSGFVMGISSKESDCERGAAHARLRSRSTHIIRSRAHIAHAHTHTSMHSHHTAYAQMHKRTHRCTGIGCVLAFCNRHEVRHVSL